MRKFLKMTFAGALGMAAVVLAVGGVSTAADEPVALKTIMQKSFNDKTGYKTTITAAAKGGKWDDANKLAKEFVELTSGIGKTKPPKGEAKDWETNCAKFCDATKAVLKATEDKDAKAVTRSLGNLGCMNCHETHREKKKKN